MKLKGNLSSLVLAISILVIGYFGYSQEDLRTPGFSFERFSTDDGLPSNAILDMVQDHEGYIWLATEDGLVRYNGYQFLNYRSIPGDTTSLSRNQPEKLFVDFTGQSGSGSF